jgi:hypothetical protein
MIPTDEYMKCLNEATNIVAVDDCWRKRRTLAAQRGEMARQLMPTGNPKDRLAQSQDKPPLHYLEPAAEEAIARAMKSGADKYGYRNFTIEPIKATVYIDALLRHILAWKNGDDVDPDSGQHPLAHIGANVHVALAAMAADKFIDDRAAMVVTPDSGPQEARDATTPWIEG